MAVFACTSCGWVRRSPAVAVEAKCPLCEAPARCLTPNGSLSAAGVGSSGRAAVAAATARALHAPGVVPLPRRPGGPRAA